MLFWHPQLTYSRLEEYAEAIEAVGGGRRIWGFVDGTFRGFCRPSDQERQRAAYSGHSRTHGLKFQAVVTPDGLVSSLGGPFLGPVNDWAMWRRLGLEDRLRRVMEGRETLFLYGDPAYRMSYGVMAPYTHSRSRHYLPDAERAFNQRLSRVRIAVEHAFGHTQVLWTYTAFAKGLHSEQQPVGVYFAVAVLLTNCYTCFRGNQTSRRFLVPPPTVEAYLNLD